MSKNKPLQKPIAIAVEGADYFYFLLNRLKNNAEFEQVQLFDFGASSKTPGMTLGQSSSTSLWDWNHESLRIMLDFIRLLQK